MVTEGEQISWRPGNELATDVQPRRECEEMWRKREKGKKRKRGEDRVEGFSKAEALGKPHA